MKVPCSPGNCVSEVLVSVGASGGRDIPLARDLRALLDDFPPLPVGPFRTGPSFTRAAGQDVTELKIGGLPSGEP